MIKVRDLIFKSGSTVLIVDVNSGHQFYYGFANEVYDFGQSWLDRFVASWCVMMQEEVVVDSRKFYSYLKIWIE